MLWPPGSNKPVLLGEQITIAEEGDVGVDLENIWSGNSWGWMILGLWKKFAGYSICGADPWKITRRMP